MTYLALVQHEPLRAFTTEAAALAWASNHTKATGRECVVWFVDERDGA